jgi:phosphate transport system permease protein
MNKVVMTLSSLAALAGLAFLFWILGVLLYKGFSALHWDIFTVDMAPPGREPSGLRNALVGQLLLVVGASVIGVPVGVLAGTYLSEYGGRHGKLARLIRDISDIMMSAPSIVIGAFVYAIMVAPMGHFSGWAGIVALAIMMLPIVLRTTDDMLQLVPGSLREAAIALGAPKYKVIMQVVYRGAKVGMLTGILLSIARIAGETAPLLFTSFSNNFYSTDLNHPIASLTVTMFNYATSPFEDWIDLGWAAALILTLFVLGSNILGRYIIRTKKGK